MSNDSDSEVEELLRAAAADPGAQATCYDTLLESQVYVLGTMDRPAVDGVAQPGSGMHLFNIEDADGACVPFFSSEPALQATLNARPGTDPHFVKLGCRDLFELTLGSRLVLNPDSAFGKVFLPHEIDSMLQGLEPGVTRQVLEAERQVLVGVPADLPPELPAALADFLAQRPSVQAAYLGGIVHSPDEGMVYLMVVVAPESDAAIAGLGLVDIRSLARGKPLDVMVARPGEDHLLSSLQPFYVRGDPT